MKLIVDAQLPSKLCEVLNQLGLESIHVNDLPKGDETPDMEILKPCTFLFALSIAVFSSCNRTKIPEGTPNVSIRYCENCKMIDEAIEFEKSIGSTQLDLSDRETVMFYAETIHVSDDLEPPEAKIFKRSSKIDQFNEYIIYFYFDYSPLESINNNKLSDAGTVEFNCGTDPLGFRPKVVNHYGVQSYERTPTKVITLEQFQSGYYSILKWLYSLADDHWHVEKEEHQLRDTDYGDNPTVPFDMMVLENAWQKEFFSNSYHLFKERSKYPSISIFPTTHAPTHLYEIPNEDYFVGRGNYHINIADMAIRIEFDPEFTGLYYESELLKGKNYPIHDKASD